MLGQTYQIQSQIVHNDGNRGPYRDPIKDKGQLENYSIRAALKA